MSRPPRAIRQAEVGAAKTMIERTEERFGIKPERSRGRYGLWFGGKPQLARQREGDRAAHPGHRQVEARGWDLLAGRLHVRQGAQRLYLPGGQDPHHDRHIGQRWHDAPLPGVTPDCRACLLKAKCCPKTPSRRIPRSIYEDARDVARALAKTEASSNRAVTASASRCCSPISSASCGSAGCGCAAHAAHKLSSRSPRSRRTYAGSPSWSLDRHQQLAACVA